MVESLSFWYHGSHSQANQKLTRRLLGPGGGACGTLTVKAKTAPATAGEDCLGASHQVKGVLTPWRGPETPC
jgi:hypothetical protein